MRAARFVRGIVILWIIAGALPTAAQPTNMQVLERLATECLDELDLPDALKLSADARFEGIAIAVAQYLRERDVRIYQADTLATNRAMSLLNYSIEDLGFAYSRAGRNYERHGSLRMAIRLLADDGEVVVVERCERMYEDRVARGDIERIERGAYPQATAELPPANIRRRVVEPVLLAGATAVSVILFFTLRSKRTTSE
jgi:hypothetical protein